MIKQHYRLRNQYKCSGKGQAPKAREAGGRVYIYNEHGTFSKNNFLGGKYEEVDKDRSKEKETVKEKENVKEKAV